LLIILTKYSCNQVVYIIVTCCYNIPHVLALSGPPSARNQIKEMY